MTTPLLEQLGRIPGAGDDIFETRDDEATDGTQDGDVDARREQRSSDVDRTAPIPGGGPLLEEEDEAKVFKTIDREVLRQERLAKNRDEEGKHWDRIKRGVQFSILEKSEDQAVYRAILPPGVEDVQQPIPNKVLDLCSKQVSQILVDPHVPDPKPDGDSEKNRGAMDLAKRFLRSDGDTSGTNDAELFRAALTMNRTRKSAFVFVWVDPNAGGWRPKQLMAHPRATDPANPLMGPKDDGSGEMEEATDPVFRYVAEVDDDEAPFEGAKKEVFTQNAADAAREWLPKHRALVLHPNQVRTLPPTAAVQQANAIILLMWEPLSEARKRFPDALNDLSKQQLKKVCEWRPKRWQAIVPELQRPKNNGLDADGEVTDDTLLFWYHKFCRISTDYPDGGEVAVNGATLGGEAAEKGFVLVRDTLREDVELEDGTTVPVLMDPPIAQFRALIDTECGDPFGLPPVSLFGGANEIRAHLYLAVLEDIDVRLRPNTYLTSMSSITKADMNRRDGTPLEVLTKDDMPVFELRPPLPPHLLEVKRDVEHEMDVGANLNETAQALDSPSSVSGEAKKVSIRQAKVQLAQDWQGGTNGISQFWRIKIQLAQGRLKKPQLVKLGGENTAYKARHFVGADMIGVSTVPPAAGTGTMMSAGEKVQFLATMQGQKWLDANEAGELARSSMSDDLGLNPSPHEEHIDRCIADWLDGPPEGWEEKYTAFQQFPQQQQQYTAALQQKAAEIVSTGQFTPEQAQAMAAAQVGPAPVQPPEPETPFEPRANDEEPVVAQIRYQKLSKLMSTCDFKDQPVTWRSCVDKAYTQAVYAAGVQTVRQQQEAQAKAAAAGQQDDANAPPQWAEFVAKVRDAAISAAATEVAKVAEGALGIGQKEEAAPAEAPPADSTALELAHTSMENERDRQHDLNMAREGHAQTMEQTHASARADLIGKQLDHAARQSARTQGAPLPERQ